MRLVPAIFVLLHHRTVFLVVQAAQHEHGDLKHDGGSDTRHNIVAIKNVPALIGAEAMGHENRGRPQLHPGSLGFDVGPGAVMRAARTCAGLLPLLRATCSYQDGARTEFQRNFGSFV